MTAHYPKHSGFTLIELIAILVVLGIVAAIGANFIVTVSNSYSAAEQRAKLISRGRLAIEQMTRQLRIALPNALRVSASGNCIEFLPIVAGANYLQSLPDATNGAPTVSTIATSVFRLGLGNAAHVAVAPLFDSEVYTFATPSARASISSLVESSGTINLTLSHRFNRNSLNRRLFITDQPKRFCIQTGNLVEYSNYGLLTSVLNDGNPGGVGSLIASNVAANGVAFRLSSGSENRNMAVGIALQFTDRSQTVSLSNTVLVRNVP